MTRGLALLVLLAAGCAAEPEPPVVRPTLSLADGMRAEVRAGSAPGCPLLGTAVHLGGGRFLTAAHIVDGTAARLRNCDGPGDEPVVRYAGRDYPAAVTRLGRGEIAPGVGLRYEGGADLALLLTRANPAGPAARVCAAGPNPGQPVVVESRFRTVEALAGGTVPEREAAYGAYVEVPLPLVPGESGSGVFDLRTSCLLGLVSHREDTAPGTVRIVTRAAIRTFLGG